MPTMLPVWLPIRCTNCWWVEIRRREKIWLRSLRYRVSKNSVDRKELFAMIEALAETVIERHRQRRHGRARRITIDLDPTDDPTHGQQQLSFFNGHYDSYCYLPMVGFLTFNHEPEQYLVTAVLRAAMRRGRWVRWGFCFG